MSYKLPDQKDLEAMIGIVGKEYAKNNKPKMRARSDPR